MLNNDIEEQPLPKRPLTKIRRPFLFRVPLESELSEPADTDQNSSTDSSQVNVLSKCLGLVEINKKILISLQYLNPFITINCSRIENVQNQKVVTMNITFNSDHLVPSWEDAVKRLESYEDKELGEWALWMRNYHENHSQVMSKYFEYLNSKDPQACIELRKAKKRAVLMCREIESKYSYRRLLAFARKESTDLLSVSYNEGMMKEIGHTPEEFLLWSKYNGLPGLFDRDCPGHLQVARNFFDFKALKKGEFVSRGPEYKVNIEDKEEKKHKMIAQYINVLDPAEGGFFLSGYLVIKYQYKEAKNGFRIKESEMSIEEEGILPFYNEEVEQNMRDKQDKIEEEKVI